ncbi:unnamed protein product [Adineta ricciae]|uniref:G-protein coupled receptors family 1 profile domain-containing protein n=1 Tax=Adineta ricciae TaxID=249248 RepID=A0A815S2W3_ADIRI|nr:unnamed protein product [Adineta ricciae]
MSLSYWSIGSTLINRYFPLPLLIFGTFGNLLNIYVFTRKTLRRNSCVQYFLCTTIVSFVALYVGLMTRLLNGYNHDYTSYSSILCKIRYFLTYLSLYCTSWFITFACFDRYCSSSRSISLRNLCQRKIVYRIIFLITFVGCLIFSETFYCFNNGNINSVASCYTISVQCQIVDGLLLMIFYTTIPICLMISFGYFTFRNIQQSRRQVTTEFKGTIIGINKRKRDLQIFTMLFVQVGILILFSSPMGLYKFYASLTVYLDKSNEPKARAKDLSGLKPQWLIGNLKNTGVSTGEVALHEVFAKLKENFGDAYLFWLGPYPSIILSRIEYVQHVLTDRHTYDQATSTTSSFGILFPSGLIALRGETWKRHARFILPMFKRAKILPYLNTIVNCIDHLVDEQFVKHNGEIRTDLVVQCQNVLLNVIARIAFDYDLELSSKTDSIHLREAFNDFVCYANQFIIATGIPPWLGKVILKLNWKFQKALITI